MRARFFARNSPRILAAVDWLTGTAEETTLLLGPAPTSPMFVSALLRAHPQEHLVRLLLFEKNLDLLIGSQPGPSSYLSIHLSIYICQLTYICQPELLLRAPCTLASAQLALRKAQILLVLLAPARPPFTATSRAAAAAAAAECEGHRAFQRGPLVALLFVQRVVCLADHLGTVASACVVLLLAVAIGAFAGCASLSFQTQHPLCLAFEPQRRQLHKTLELVADLHPMECVLPT